jgi:SAM-dependent methyltransferase
VTRSETAERIGAAAAMRAQLADAEGLARYRWAAGFVEGARVLDAGCGLGYGSAILAEAGAAEVVGLDIAPTVVEAARGRVPHGVELGVGDLASLVHPAGSFDAIVCFDVLDHAEDPAAVVAELARVLVPGGVLAVSAGEPGGEGVRALLRAHWPQVRSFEQHGWLASAVLDPEHTRGAEALPEAELHTAMPRLRGSHRHSVALASAEPLPEPPPLAVLTGDAEARRWLERYDAQGAVLDAQRERLRELDTLQYEREQLRDRLLEAEAEITRTAQFEAQLAGAGRMIEEIVGSASWRLTRPLRGLKSVGQRLLRR